MSYLQHCIITMTITNIVKASSMLSLHLSSSCSGHNNLVSDHVPTLVKILHWLLILHGVKLRVWPIMPYTISMPAHRPPTIKALTSFIIPPFAHAAPAIVAFVLYSKFNKHAPASGPLHLLFLLLETLFSPYSLPLGLCSNVTWRPYIK